MKPTSTSSLLTLIQPYLEDLRTRKVTNRQVAEALGYSPEHVSRTLTALNLVKDPPPKSERRRQHELFEARQALRRELANTLPPKLAARQARCSLRTIYRYKDAP